jgi:hypothetical protein
MPRRRAGNVQSRRGQGIEGPGDRARLEDVGIIAPLPGRDALRKCRKLCAIDQVVDVVHNAGLLKEWQTQAARSNKGLTVITFLLRKRKVTKENADYKGLKFA